MKLLMEIIKQHIRVTSFTELMLTALRHIGTQGEYESHEYAFYVHFHYPPENTVEDGKIQSAHRARDETGEKAKTHFDTEFCTSGNPIKAHCVRKNQAHVKLSIIICLSTTGIRRILVFATKHTRHQKPEKTHTHTMP